jgi:hypothetical protein
MLTPKDLSICMVDFGTFTYMLDCLVPAFKKVAIACPRSSGFPKTDRDDIGSGIEGVENIPWPDFWNRYHDYDIFWFPFIGHGGLANHLRSMGKKVISTFKGEDIERDRGFFKDKLVEVGLPVIPYRGYKHGKCVHGWDELRKEMQANENFWIKMSDFRGLGETHHVKDYADSERWLFELGHLLACGRQLHTFPFHLEDHIPAEEMGDDVLFNGKNYLSKCLYGKEDKDSGYLCKVVEFKKLPPMMKEVHDKMLPYFRACGLQSPISTEIRAVSKILGYWNDATQRIGSPPGEIMSEIWNLPEILVAIAYGEDIVPQEVKKYGASIFLYSEQLKTEPVSVTIPMGLKRWVKLQNCMRQDGRHICIPQDEGSVLGSVVGIGDTKLEAEENALEVAGQVKAEGIYYAESVFERIEEDLEKAKEFGLGF